MIRQLPLTNSDKTILVDEDTYARYRHLNFYLTDDGYARTTITSMREMLHRLITSPGTLRVDHINGNGLDNRRCNLRVCSHSQNCHNRGVNKNNLSGYKGVSSNGDKWKCRVSANGLLVNGSVCLTKHSAAIHYNVLARELHGDYFNGNTVSDLHPNYYYELAH